MTEYILQARNIVKSFGGNQVLRDVSLNVEAGELVSIIGPSGCGKSTFLRCLNFLETPDSGEVTVPPVQVSCDGGWGRQQERQSHLLRQRVGMVFQGFNLFPHLNVLENICLSPIHTQGVPRERIMAEGRELLSKVGLAHAADRYPDFLSGGEKQRVAIARALAMKPSVMLYDEPTSALDPERSEEVLSVMRTLDREGMTQLVVTHDMRFVREASDRILFFEEGRIIADLPPEQFFSLPPEGRISRFLRAG